VVEEKRAPDVGARIREARDILGIPQTALAALLGAGERTVQAWERNERTPRMDTLARIGALVDRPVSWFYETPEPEKEAV
jgi:transcriptional regulator with XRE-family HTH domain